MNLQTEIFKNTLIEALTKQNINITNVSSNYTRFQAEIKGVNINISFCIDAVNYFLFTSLDGTTAQLQEIKKKTYININSGKKNFFRESLTDLTKEFNKYLTVLNNTL